MPKRENPRTGPKYEKKETAARPARGDKRTAKRSPSAKPAGAKPGFVTYDKYYTAYVTPKDHLGEVKNTERQK